MTDNSGAAYPRKAQYAREQDAAGLTKREYFAGQALAAILGGYWANSDLNGLGPDEITSASVEYAEALIAALGGKDD